MSLFDEYAQGAIGDIQKALGHGQQKDPAVWAVAAQAEAMLAVGAAIRELAEKVGELPGSVG